MGTDAMYVHGYLSRRDSMPIAGGKWTGVTNVTIHADEFLFDGQEHSGMSGASTLNSCGYAGMAHASIQSQGRTYYHVIKAQYVLECIRNNKERLKRIEDCALPIIQPPVFSWCPA